jgi:predicted alpha/beta hydrolase family esterase
MTPQYKVVAVHGINDASGKTEAGFSKELANLVLPGMAWPNAFWREAVWEEVCDDLDSEIKKIVTELVNSYDFEDYFRTRMAKRKGFRKILSCLDLFAVLFAKGVVPDFVSGILDLALDLPLYLGDAYGPQIRDKVERELQRTAKETEGIVVVGHSLGSVIAHDVVAKLLAEPSPPPIRALVTMGSPLEWVTALRKNTKGISETHSIPESFEWINFYNKSDPVPIKRALSEETFPGVENVLVSTTDKNPLAAHSTYWTDTRVADRIRQLVAPPEKDGASDCHPRRAGREPG